MNTNPMTIPESVRFIRSELAAQIYGQFNGHNLQALQHTSGLCFYCLRHIIRQGLDGKFAAYGQPSTLGQAALAGCAAQQGHADTHPQSFQSPACQTAAAGAHRHACELAKTNSSATPAAPQM
jgi:hypothetical protein